MQIKVLAAVCAAAFALASVAGEPADAATKKKQPTTANKYAKRPVPVTMDPPRARIVVRGRSYLDPGRVIAPGSQPYFTDYAFPPAYSPTAVIDYQSGGRSQTALPGPFTLPGRDNPYPWNWCVGC
jgi:hypothetical protein